MAEAQCNGVQMKALHSKSINGLIDFECSSINWIAKDRVSDLRQMAS